MLLRMTHPGRHDPRSVTITSSITAVSIITVVVSVAVVSITVGHCSVYGRGRRRRGGPR